MRTGGIVKQIYYLKNVHCENLELFKKQDAVVLQSNTKSPTGVHWPFIKRRDCGWPQRVGVGGWLVLLNAS